MKAVRFIVAMLMCSAFSAFAFVPASGAWLIDSENNGQPGRGMNIEVENGIVVLSYYGYRPDGTSLYYLAVGAMSGNIFSAYLQEYGGGKSLGGSEGDASSIGSPGMVTISFSSGLSGSITFPGESPKAISKYGFGYGTSAASLYGTYLMTYIASTTTFSQYRTLSRSSGATSTGGGVATTSDNKFGCEYQISGTFIGQILCVQVTGSMYDDIFFFRMSGDRGAGVGTYYASSYYYEAHVIRTRTASGRLTGINDGTVISLNNKSSLAVAAETGAMVPESPIAIGEFRQGGIERAVAVAAEEQLAFRTWQEEAQKILSSR